MGCICARRGNYGRWKCTITGDECIFFVPSQDACADKYGEVEHTEKWNMMKKERSNHERSV